MPVYIRESDVRVNKCGTAELGVRITRPKNAVDLHRFLIRGILTRKRFQTLDRPPSMNQDIGSPILSIGENHTIMSNNGRTKQCPPIMRPLGQHLIYKTVRSL